MRSGRPIPINIEAQQGSSITLLARLESMPSSSGQAAAGTPYVQADIESIRQWVYAGDEIADDREDFEIDVADVITDTLQGWTVDIIGYNFRHALPPEAFPTGNVLAKVMYEITLTSGYKFSLEFSGPVRAVPQAS